MKILIFGIGNAGLRHYNIFKEFGCDVSYIDPSFPKYDGQVSLEQTDFTFNQFDAFVIATRVEQRTMIPMLQKLGKPTLIEKPLFVDHSMFADTKAQLYSGYFRDKVWVGLQMPFMRSYVEFREQVINLIRDHDFDWQRISASECYIHVVACSDAEKWVGIRGKHTAHLPPIYEFFHDLDLGFRLLPDRVDLLGKISRSISSHSYSRKASGVIGFPQLPGFQFTLCSNDDLPECRRITVRVGEKVLQWELNREENAVAYQSMDAAFYTFVLSGTRPWQSMTVDRWEREMDCLGLLS